MKKILFIVFLLISTQISTLAVNFGTYKTETDYGLIDGFKWNFFNRDKNAPLVQLKSETEEEKARLEKQKDKPKEKMSDSDEIQMYRFMLEDTVAF
ncbi:MAG: hypothetical protein IJ877_00055 [Candidatus Gastranaerophilales bacterium]|nr:hypothetical protein [Candidatus Gastranaerophilales bacterium]